MALLKEYMLFKNGKKRPKEKGKIPVYGGNGILDYTNIFNLENGVIIGRVGAYCGSVFLSNGKSWVSDNAIIAKVKNNSDLFYFYYLLKNLHLNMRHIGTGQPLLTQKILNNIEVRVPDIDKQIKIGKLLSEIDFKIKLNKKINNNLEQQASALFKSWFVDFEPFGYAMPSNWEVATLDTIADFQNGYAFKSKDLLSKPAPNTYKVFKQGHISRGGGFISDGTKSWYPKSSATSLGKFILRKGDILMAMTDMKDNVAILGNTAIMPVDNEYIVNQRVGHLRANNYKGITYPYIYLLTNNKNFLTDLRSRANSGVQVNLSSAEIKLSEIVIATEKINKAFSDIVMPMCERIIQNQLENQRLAVLRDTLIPKLMSGELDVSEIDL